MIDERDEYDEAILGFIENEEKWLTFENKEMIINLIKIADQQFATQKMEGILSAVLIYQQVLEEFLRVLLGLSNLYIQGEIWPSRIKLEVRDKMMFGQLLKEHQRTIDFDCKKELLNSCQNFSEIRNRFVHKLLKFDSEQEMFSEAKNLKQLFHQALDYYLRSRTFLEWKLLDLKKRLGLEDS
jgi:hypothetical protein